jgi:surface polysaccharide O-acyltransferase-like enzyme
MIHVHSWSFDKLSPNDQRGFLLIDTLCYWSVPIFIMLSGALLLNIDQARSHESPGTFLKKRWRRMIRPTIAWGIIALIWGCLALGRGRDETFRRMMTGLPNDPQWFLFMLLGLYALTPWLRMLLASSLAWLDFFALRSKLFCIDSTNGRLFNGSDFSNQLFDIPRPLFAGCDCG